MPERELAAALLRVETSARVLADDIRAAEAAGVSGAALAPTLITVFKEAGMMPAWLDIEQLAGLLG